MKRPDCHYYDNGNCAKALPDVPCEIEGCVAFLSKQSKLRNREAWITRAKRELEEGK